MFFSKEINRLRNVKHLLLRKTGVLRTYRKNFFYNLMVYDVIYSLLVLIENLAFFNKQL